MSGAPRKVLFVLTSHGELGTTGLSTGFWLEEFAAPYYELADAGVEIVLASPLGGQPPVDPKSDDESAQSEATVRFHDDTELKRRLGATVKLHDVDPSDFDAIFYPGGHGPLWDLPDNPDSIRLLEAFADAHKPIVAVCHGPIAFKNVTTGGVSLVKGRSVTGFSDAEEAAAGLTAVVPELLEDMLIAEGASYTKATADFAPHVVVDGTLITGQNPASSTPAARALIDLLAKRDETDLPVTETRRDTPSETKESS